MADKTNPVTTQRAYTLRLRGADPQDQSWRDALWATHEAVNKGAKVFGDWLLTLRGGLDHRLADAKIKGGKNKPDCDPTPEERRNRRILLALSWLSVESLPRSGDTYEQFVVASGKNDSPAARNQKVVDQLREILKKRGLNDKALNDWVNDCQSSLSAAIRDDAVWVNRSVCFEQCAIDFDKLDRQYAALTIMSFFGPVDDYFALPSIGKEDSSDASGVSNDGPEFRTLARQWVSTNFGTGEKSDTAIITKNLRELAKAELTQFVGGEKTALIAEMSKVLDGQTRDVDGLRVAVGWKTGRASKGRMAIDTLPDLLTNDAIEGMQQKFSEEADDKEKKSGTRDVPSWMPYLQKHIEESCGMPFKIGAERDHIGEFSVMLDHAARRVSIGHSWIKRAEAERQKFSADAERLSDVPAAARAWLDEYCQTRTGISSAIEPYRIRKRAAEGWKQVVSRWSRADCKTEVDRVAAAREVQADPEIDKFGDIQLFEALASDGAKCVWQPNGNADAQPLIDYVAATDALAKQKRFKVPAYRHPDPLLHPVFCDFGNSRWDIRFAAHQAPSKLDAARKKVEQKRAAVEKARAKLDNATTPEKQDKSRGAVEAAAQQLREAEVSEAWLSSRHSLSMGLWDGNSISSDLPLCWSSKRLMKDLSLRSSAGQTSKTGVTRADRLGRAAANASKNDPVEILGVFDEKHWNGRLQAPRSQLNAIAARVSKHGWDSKAKRMRDSIRWLVTFSAKLQSYGPWMELAAQSEGILHDPAYWPHAESNKHRKGHGRLILSRLPGLRLLSVDLGHRFAAACVVWEALSSNSMKNEIAGREIVIGGVEQKDLFCHTRHSDARGKTRTTIFRRIGADTLPDGKPHPAPWARLDRQFMIKLPGEDKPARAATDSGEANEMAMVQQLAKDLGLVAVDHQDKGRAVDQLMSRAVRVLKIALNRHARRAKISYALDPQTKSIPGMGGSEKAFTPGDEDHIRFLTNTLFDWHALASEAKWNDKTARDLWNEHVASLDNQWRIHDPDSDASADADLTRPQRRKKDDERREQLKRIAEGLAKADRTAMHRAWKQRWEKDDGTPADHEAGRKATGCHAHLRLITDWIMGRRLPGAVGNGWRQNVGGLSLTRIATMRSLYQLHKAFAMRAKPDKPRGAPEKGETNAGVAQSILNAMEKMREQRVKQLASRVTEAALGIGRIKSEHLEVGAARPRAQVDKPCHAVVIENLTNYRPDELQTRRENRQLMAWSSSKVKKFLSESCQLHGLHLREIQAGYTSRQDSRTGAPGMRCKDVPVEEFMTAPWWRRQVNRANEKVNENKGDARDRYLHELDMSLAAVAAQRGLKSVRIPVSGGELFVAAAPHSPSVKGLQADLNAAANVGLRALLDPDWSGKWWYVPCASATHEPHPDKVEGSDVFKASEPLAPLPDSSSSQNGSKPAKKQREIVNFWRDPSPAGPQSGQEWRGTAAYWNGVRCRVVRILSGAYSDTNGPIESPETPW